jgi:Tol biopolymer transport system component
MDGQNLFQHRVRGFVPTIAMLLPLAGLVAACSNDATSTPTAIVPSSSAGFGKNVSGSNQKILFETTRDADGGHEVYSINPDGTGPTRLTNNPRDDRDAVWSPNGKQIAFRSTRDNVLGEIYVMNADGTEVVRLTNSIGSNDEPSWSRDGKQIVFTSNRGAVDPASGNFDDDDVYVMNADGSNVIRLTNDNTGDRSPVFSPDGRSIAFTSVRDHPGTGDAELYLMNVDGTNVTRLTFQHGRVSHPSWDSHSRRIAFGLSGSAEGGIYTLNLDDLGLTRLTFVPDQGDDFPSWSADGSKLAFTSRRDGDSEIYVMNADGTEQTRLTVNPGEDAFPRWSR